MRHTVSAASLAWRKTGETSRLSASNTKKNSANTPPKKVLFSRFSCDCSSYRQKEMRGWGGVGWNAKYENAARVYGFTEATPRFKLATGLVTGLWNGIGPFTVCWCSLCKIHSAVHQPTTITHDRISAWLLFVLLCVADYSQGFGGKYGVQSDRVDQSAKGWSESQKVDEHASQVSRSSACLRMLK